MTTAAKLTPIPERLKRIRDGEIILGRGKHSPPPPGCTHPEGCDREIRGWALGLPWGDDPDDCSSVINAFRRRLNDALPEDLRQKLEDTMFDDIGTAGDGRDEDRAWMITDWSIRVALPTWLDLAGVKDSPAQLRALPEVTAETFGDARPLVYKLRDEAWERRKAWRAKLAEAIKVELKKRGIERPAAADAAAAAVAVAVADADAVAAAVAVAVAVAVADAVADAAAVAVAVADADAAAAAAAVAVADADAVAAAAAVAVADADAVAAAAAVAVAVADADAAAAAWRPGVYSAVYRKLKPIYQAKFGEKYEPTQTSLLASAEDLIKRMCALEPAE